MITDPSKKKVFFEQLCEIKADDHPHVKFVKEKMKKMLDQELEELGFAQQISEEEKNELLTEAYQEVKSRSTFYFKYDPNKK